MAVDEVAERNAELKREVERLTRELDARNAELTEALEQRVATSEILQVISRSPTDVQPVFDAIAENAARICHARFCAVYRFDGELIHFVAHHGLSPEGVAVMNQEYPMPPGRGSTAARAILTAEAAHVPDIEADPEYAVGNVARANRARSISAVPMLKYGKPIGAIAVARARPEAFSERQIEILRTFADQAVIAIENVRLFEELQARNRELAEVLEQRVASGAILNAIAASPTDIAPVLKVVADNAAQICQAFDATIFLPHAGALAVAAHSGPIPIDFDQLPLKRGVVTSRAFIDRAPIHIHDLLEATAEFPEGRQYAVRLGFRTILALPLMRDQEAIGAVMLRRNEVRPFTDKQISILQTFADQAVIAIANVRLFEEVQARNRELAETLEQQVATSAILRAIAASPTDIEPVLKTVAESAAQLCDAYDATILLPRGEALIVAANHGPMPIDFTEMPIGRDYVVTRSFVEGAPIHVHDISTAEAEFPVAQKLAARLGVRTILATPLLREGEPIGALMIRRNEVRPFSDKQIELLRTFADQAVIAIANVRLFEEVQTRTAELSEALQQQTATAEILGVINSSLDDTQPVFDAIVQSGIKLFSGAAVSIALRDGEEVRAAAVAESDRGRAEAWRNRFPFPLSAEYMHGAAILHHRVVDIPDVASAPGEFALGAQNFLASGYRAITIVPLMRADEAIGALSVVRVESGPLSDKQRAILQTFASQAVIAIENTRLLRELRETLQQQTATADVLKVISRSAFDLDAVLTTLIGSAIVLCDATRGVIWLRRGEQLFLAAHVNYPGEWVTYAESNPITPAADAVTASGLAAFTGEIVHVQDILNDPRFRSLAAHSLGDYRAGLTVPLKREGRVEGVISLSRPIPQLFTERQVELVRTFADQAVIAIENARLFDEVQARTRELTEALQFQTATSDVLNVISRSPSDLRPVLNTIVQTAHALCQADYALFFRLGADGLYHIAAGKNADAGFLDWLKSNPIAKGDGTATGIAALEVRTIHLADALSDPRFTDIRRQQRSKARTQLAVPLARAGEAIGVIFLARTEVRPFTDKQVNLVTVFADQAVIAINNVGLFEEVQARTRDLSASLEELRTAQDRLIQTEKLASLGQLTAGIAHEIKNPLNFVNNFSSVSGELVEELRELVEGAALDGKTRTEVTELAEMLKGNLEKIVQHGKRADSIVKNMLLHSRQGSGEHRPVDINGIVEESLNLAYHGARAEKRGFNITLERSFDPAAGQVDIYPQEITRVLLNLISNGFHATTKRRDEANGAAYEPVLSASTKNLGESVEIRIRDNGTGISPETKAKMFTPFFTTKPAGEGTGLGLSISHDIVVKQHGGTIEVDTEPGAFTEFRIVLPRRAASLAASGAAA